MLRRVAFTAGAAVATIALLAGPAGAFECYNANRSAQGNAAAGAHSKGLLSFTEILTGEVGLCEEGAAFVIAGAEAEGFRSDVLINGHTLMAGGLEKNGKGESKLHDGQGIDHLSQEFFDTVEPLIGQAFGICAAA
jgi:hypothetical protein